MQLQKDMPDHHDADLVIRLYELRREAVMRESRSAVNQFWPRTAEEALAVAAPAHPLNAPFRQVLGYWEMVYGMAVHGIVHADYLVENNGEGLYFYARFEPFLERIRATYAPRAFQHTEWVARETSVGRGSMERLRTLVAKMTAGSAS